MTRAHARAFHPTYRLVSSRFPPVTTFDTVATPADLAPVMELAGWTNDRLVAERIARLPADEWVYGRTNSSVVMGAFLHVAPAGMRFNSADLGAWYAAAAPVTSGAEVGHHLRREAVATGVAEIRRRYRCYSARLEGDYLDLRGQQGVHPDVYASDSHAASQAFGEAMRASGGAGILYDSVRHAGGVNVVAHRPRNVLDVVQADHFEITARAASRRIDIKRLTAQP